jgi:NADPH-dependent 2,4-dienoyl-CoA reductase/sulfur reductase-like enzyme
MNRRKFLGAAAGLPALGWPLCAPGRARAERRVVVLGGGVAGVAFALTLSRLAPQAEVTLVEPHERFLFAAASLDYVFGRAPLSAITRDYGALARRGVRHLRAEAIAIEPQAQRVRTSAGTLEYGHLVIASGVRLATEEVAGLAEAPETNTSIYERRHLAALRERVADFQGGTALVSIPPPPHSCPPASYEFALLLAERIRLRRLKARVLVLDASPQPQPAPLSAAFDGAFRGASGVIEYVPAIRVARLEPGAKRVMSADGESFSYELLSLIPPHKAPRFIADAGLTEGADPFVQVDPTGFRSLRHETIYALGDAARTPFARTAESAREAAQRCAHTIARALGARVPQPGPLDFDVLCYPYASEEQAMHLRMSYRAEKEALDVRVIADTHLAHAYVAARQAWQVRFVQDLFAA